MPKVFGIFEGGGARGIAHIGALKAAEERSIEFSGVAGTSAGAIIAALVSVGFTADTLYDPSSEEEKKGVFDINFVEKFFGGQHEWEKVISLRKDAEKTFSSLNFFPLYLNIPFFYFRHRDIVNKLMSRFGIFNSDKFKEWLEECLALGLSNRLGLTPEEIPRPIQFRDTFIPLKIVATNLNSRKIEVYSCESEQTYSPDSDKIVSVADAVCASLSIPLFFEPKINRDSVLVDGGLVSNFPAWVFDHEREKLTPNVPTFGFRLIEETNIPKPSSLYSIVRGIVATTIAGDEILETRRIDNLHVIHISTATSTFDFDLNHKQKRDLFNEGKMYTRDYFQKVTDTLFDSNKVNQLLKQLSFSLEGLLGRLIGNTNIFHLRLNVMLPNGKGGLKVYYSHNMDEDADDCLSISLDSPGAGACWREKQATFCEMEEIRSASNKYLNALVRQSLAWMMSIPIPDPRDRRGRMSSQQLLGVLNIDSDDESLLTTFIEDRQLQEMAEETAQFIGSALTRVYD